MKNLWLLSEENPRPKVLEIIIERFCSDNNFTLRKNKIKIIPLMEGDRFSFTYKISGLECEEICNIYVKIITGNSSLVDYLVFYQELTPDDQSIPLYAIEETKTTDKESRNTGIYQRSSKFVFIDFYYPKVKKIMLYNLKTKENNITSSSNVFGTKLLNTIDVEILGKKLNEEMKQKFNSIDELINAKSLMKNPPKNNVPIKLEKHDEKITISGRLNKNNSLSYDPNIGLFAVLVACLRSLGWSKKIVIVNHGLFQEYVGKRNKFIQIANKLNVDIEGIILPIIDLNTSYWRYDITGEKNVTILIQVLIENYTSGSIIYENHAGSGRGYFYDNNNDPITIGKYQKGLRNAYKTGDKSVIISIPDIIIFDNERSSIISVEGKKYSTRKKGIVTLLRYSYIETEFIKRFYSPKLLQRTVVLFGSHNQVIKDKDVGLILTYEGEIITGETTPKIIKDGVTNLLTL